MFLSWMDVGNASVDMLFPDALGRACPRVVFYRWLEYPKTLELFIISRRQASLTETCLHSWERGSPFDLECQDREWRRKG
jgi:hypothetical protein